VRILYAIENVEHSTSALHLYSHLAILCQRGVWDVRGRGIDKPIGNDSIHRIAIDLHAWFHWFKTNQCHPGTQPSFFPISLGDSLPSSVSPPVNASKILIKACLFYLQVPQASNNPARVSKFQVPGAKCKRLNPSTATWHWLHSPRMAVQLPSPRQTFRRGNKRTPSTFPPSCLTPTTAWLQTSGLLKTRNPLAWAQTLGDTHISPGVWLQSLGVLGTCIVAAARNPPLLQAPHQMPALMGNPAGSCHPASVWPR